MCLFNTLGNATRHGSSCKWWPYATSDVRALQGTHTPQRPTACTSGVPLGKSNMLLLYSPPPQVHPPSPPSSLVTHTPQKLTACTVGLPLGKNTLDRMLCSIEYTKKSYLQQQTE
jgi:hypothetical protein